MAQEEGSFAVKSNNDENHKIVEIDAQKKVRGRPFAPGNQFGKGRPKGSRNKDTPERALLNQYAESLMKKCLFLALQGDIRAMRMCLNRIDPPRRGAQIRMRLPEIHSTADIQKAAGSVAQAICKGRLTPAEGDTMMSVLENWSRVIERAEFEDKLRELQKQIEDSSKKSSAA